MTADVTPTRADQPIIAANAPRGEIDYSVRVDKVGVRTKVTKTVRILLIAAVALIMLIPIYWMGATAFKSRADAIAVPPKIIFTPTAEGFVNLLTDRAVLNKARLEKLKRCRHRTRCDQHLRHKKLAFFEQLANFAHGVNQPVMQNTISRQSFVQRLLHQFDRRITVAFNNCLTNLLNWHVFPNSIF